MRETNRTGLTTHLAVAKRLTELEYEVLQPMDESAPYDLAFVAMTGNGWFRSSKPILYRVQCKSAHYYEEGRHNGVITFNAYAAHGGNGKKGKGYWGKAEYFGVYCTDLDKVYLVPVLSFANATKIQLRIKKPKNNQEVGVVWAKDYEL
ncbi:MAG: group I intron-associated PD-(D/E)XK endonuclease [Ktedonobacteraceae bacterium]